MILALTSLVIGLLGHTLKYFEILYVGVFCVNIEFDPAHGQINCG